MRSLVYKGRVAPPPFVFMIADRKWRIPVNPVEIGQRVIELEMMEEGACVGKANAEEKVNSFSFYYFLTK